MLSFAFILTVTRYCRLSELITWQLVLVVTKHQRNVMVSKRTDQKLEDDTEQTGSAQFSAPNHFHCLSHTGVCSCHSQCPDRVNRLPGPVSVPCLTHPVVVVRRTIQSPSSHANPCWLSGPDTSQLMLVREAWGK